MKRKNFSNLAILMTIVATIFSCEKEYYLSPSEDSELSVIILSPQEAEKFHNDIIQFDSSISLQNDVLYLDYNNLNKIGICDLKLKRYIVSLNHYNEEKRNGHIDNYLQYGVHYIRIDSEKATKSGLLERHDEKDNDVIYTNYGFIHKFDLTHEGVIWMLYGQAGAAGLLAFINGPIGFMAGIEVGYWAVHYDLYGSGSGMTIWIYYAPFFGFQTWCIYKAE